MTWLFCFLIPMTLVEAATIKPDIHSIDHYPGYVPNSVLHMYIVMCSCLPDHITIASIRIVSHCLNPELCAGHYLIVARGCLQLGGIAIYSGSWGSDTWKNSNPNFKRQKNPVCPSIH